VTAHSDGTAIDTGPDRPEGGPSRRDRQVIIALTWLIMVAVANTGSTAVAQPAIRAHFGIGPADVAWLVFGYTAVFAVSTAWYGAAARRFGASRSLMVGATLLGLGAVGAAFADRFWVLLALRLLQGFGAGAIPTLAVTIAGERLSPSLRARATAIIIAGVGIGQALGPILGGLLVDLVSWRAAVAVGSLALPAILITARHRSPSDPSQRIDVGGGLALGVFIVSIAWLLNRLPSLGLSPSTVVMAVLAVLVAVFIRRHLRVHPAAIVPREVLQRPGFAGVVCVAALLLAIFIAVVTGIPLILELQSGTTVGLIMLPMALALAGVSAVSSAVVRSAGLRRTIAYGVGLISASTVTSTIAIMQGGPLGVAFSLIPLGMGYGLLASPLSERVSALFESRWRSTALGAYNVVFFVGGVGGGSIASALIDRSITTPAAGLAQALIALGVIAAATAIGVRTGRLRASFG
jgi:MFS family permease